MKDVDAIDLPYQSFRRFWMLPPLPGFEFEQEWRACLVYLEQVVVPLVLHLRPLDPATATAADRIVWNAFGSAANDYYAVLCLTLDGMGIQATLLSRPMAESLLTAFWAHENPNDAEARYGLYDRFLRSTYAEAYQAGGWAKDDVSSGPELSEQELDQARKLFGQYCERSITGRSLQRLIDDYLRSIAHAPARWQMTRYWTAIHRYVNWSLHSTTFVRVPTVRPEGSLDSMGVVGPTNVQIKMALNLAWNNLGQHVGLVADHFGFDEEREAKLQRGLIQVWEAFVGPEVMSALGRNDPCPCSSGRKYKNCHGR